MSETKHPEDIAVEKEGREYAKANIDEWFAHNADRLKETIAEYADGDAENLWWLLREDFWTREWEKKR